jgi:hypothetical protein
LKVDITQKLTLQQYLLNNVRANLPIQTMAAPEQHEHTPKQCLLCNSTKTYFDKQLQKEIWLKHKQGDEFLCFKCYTRNRRSKIRHHSNMLTEHIKQKMSDRRCFICESATTGIVHRKKTGKTSIVWYRHKNGFICSRCYLKSIYIPKTKEKRLEGPKICSMCNADKTKISVSTGSPIWYTHKDGENNRKRICYYCWVRQKRDYKRESNFDGRCGSDICRSARKTHSTICDYSEDFYCIVCRTSHPKELIRCPCCHNRMRTRPVNSKSRQRKDPMKPKVYY